MLWGRSVLRTETGHFQVGPTQSEHQKNDETGEEDLPFLNHECGHQRSFSLIDDMHPKADVPMG
jgi:hypothetical protein